MDRFGDNVYNLYGSTEVAYATVATPRGPARRARHRRQAAARDQDLRSSTRTGREVPQGEVGRIFVGNEMSFEGYTGGGGKEMIDGLLSSGDVGHIDADGRLFIDGRDDEMIVSGGENVFPREVEDLLADHEAVDEVAVIGVEDAEFGQRLKAFVVVRDGRRGLRRATSTAHVKANLASYKSAARGRVPRRAAAQRDRQGPEAGPARARDRSSPPERSAGANCGLSARAARVACLRRP